MESYLIQSNVALTVFYLLYRAVIFQESNQQLKRIMGLSIAMFCSCFTLLPAITFESSVDLPLAFQDAIRSTASFQSSLESIQKESMSIWLIVYLIGVGIFSFRFLFGVYGIVSLYIRSEVSKRWGFVLVQTRDSISPFSFFNYLFIKKEEVESPHLSPIILHEQFHKDQFHSVDAILLEFLTILFWFNPFMWLLKKDIKASHEYLADDYVISDKGFDKLEYQNLLFEARTGASFKPANFLSIQTSLKQRFIMMEKRKKRSKLSFLRAGTVLVAMAVSLFITSFSPFQDTVSDDGISFQIFTKDGKVDMEKGVSKETDRLFVRIIPKEGDELKYWVAQIETTLVSGGKGRWSIKSGDMVQLGAKLSNLSEESMLLLEIKEYQIQNEYKQVEKVTPEKLTLFKIPIY